MNSVKLQEELLLLASKYQINILHHDDILKAVNSLMDRGIYDDLMLDILDYDPIYHGYYDFLALLENLGCSAPSMIDACWIINFDAIKYRYDNSFISKFVDFNIMHYFFIYFDIWDEYLLDADDIINVICRIDDAEGSLYNGYLHKGYNDNIAMKVLYDELKDACHAWLNKHGVVVRDIKSKYFAC